MPNVLRADCSQCAGLCCVAPAFAASSDFAIDKKAGQPCPNLHTDFRCGIHTELRPRGFPGCTVFDCFGAGQQVTQVTFEGRTWRDTPRIAGAMFAVFPIMRQLHELLWYLTEALRLDAVRQPSAQATLRDLALARDRTEDATRSTPDELTGFDVDALRHTVNPLLQRASELARARYATSAAATRRLDRRGADLIGKNLRGTDLSGANLRGAYLIGTDLRGADLTCADLTGADLRGADVSGADLRTALFLTQSQLDAARGDRTTMLAASHERPEHWSRPPARRRG